MPLARTRRTSADCNTSKRASSTVPRTPSSPRSKRKRTDRTEKIFGSAFNEEAEPKFLRVAAWMTKIKKVLYNLCTLIVMKGGGAMDSLFAMPGFLTAMGSAIDIGSTLTEYNVSRTPEEADYFALCSDWDAVGIAIRKAGQEAVDAR